MFLALAILCCDAALILWLGLGTITTRLGLGKHYIKYIVFVAANTIGNRPNASLNMSSGFTLKMLKHSLELWSLAWKPSRLHSQHVAQETYKCECISVLVIGFVILIPQSRHQILSTSMTTVHLFSKIDDLILNLGIGPQNL